LVQATVGVTLQSERDSGNAQSCAGRTGRTSGLLQIIESRQIW